MSISATKHKNWIEPQARFGYAASGVVYLIIGVLAIWSAIFSAETTDSEVALQTPILQLSGQILLGIMVIGLSALVSYCLQFTRFQKAFGGRSTLRTCDENTVTIAKKYRCVQ